MPLILAITTANLPGPYTVSDNFPADLYGAVDTRMSNQSCGAGPCIWGRADVALLPIRFHPPAGYRLHGSFDQSDRSRANAWSHPVIANGKLYLRDQDVLICYDLRRNG